MLWLSMRIEICFAGLVVWLLLCLLPLTAQAQNLETVVMPGQVIGAHARIEGQCDQCHLRFKPKSQPQLCLSCHTELDADVRSGAGYHGHLPESQCRQCHTEHKGREARIVLLDEKNFDHRRTDFPLKGRHLGKECANCHRPTVKHRLTPSECVSCHRGNDRHRGTLGEQCQSCHTEDQWSTGRFDHGGTRFPLQNRHAQLRCASCHSNETYAGTGRDCVSCHQGNDAHKGANGPRCESCHTDQDWKMSIFQHERDTGFALMGRHKGVACASCHREPASVRKPETRCISCHRSDDAHKGAMGERCETCHTPDGWKASRRFDHDLLTRFALRDKHRTLTCNACHKSAEKPPMTCVSCHQKDDEQRGHKGRYGARCDTCHQENSWRSIIFQHDRDTRFPLTGKHGTLKCDTCHKSGPYLVAHQDRCFSCHKHDDIHFGSLEQTCDSCHLPDHWRKIRAEALKNYCRRPLDARSASASGMGTPSGPSFWTPDCIGIVGR